MMDENDEYGFCPECRRRIGEDEWNGECGTCEQYTYPCQNSDCEEQVYIEGSYCLRCEKIITDAMIESRLREDEDEEEVN